jgi:hypothetical protein
LFGSDIASERHYAIADQEQGNQDDQNLQQPEAVFSLKGYSLTLDHRLIPIKIC